MSGYPGHGVVEPNLPGALACQGTLARAGRGTLASSVQPGEVAAGGVDPRPRTRRLLLRRAGVGEGGGRRPGYPGALRPLVLGGRSRSSSTLHLHILNGCIAGGVRIMSHLCDA
eukprot:9363913-Pyramimonas_sp.AAC.2